MSITETVLVFVCIPLAVVLLVYALVYGTSAARSRRYRPGRVFEPTPVWYNAGAGGAMPSEVRTRELARDGGGAGGGGADNAAEWPEAKRTGEVGGASDSW